MNVKEQYISEDGGIYLSSFLRTVVQWVEKLSNGGETDRMYSINPSSRRIVIQTKQIRYGANSFVIRFFIDRDLQMIQVRLIEIGQNNDNYGVNGMELGTQYLEVDMNEVGFIRNQTNLAYGNMTKLPENVQLTTTQINQQYKNAFDLVSEIIVTTLQYADEYARSGNVKSSGSGVLPNGMAIDYTINGNNNISIDVNFGEILSRSVKLDSMFI